MKTLDNKKVFVSTPETSKAVQEKAFKLGYEWGDGQKISYTNFPFLFFTRTTVKSITTNSEFETFRNHDFEEITAAEILAMDIPEPEERFYTFQKVLVRNENNKKWFPEFYREKTNLGYVTIGGALWNECIDYKKNKHLAFTTEKPGF